MIRRGEKDLPLSAPSLSRYLSNAFHLSFAPSTTRAYTTVLGRCSICGSQRFDYFFTVLELALTTQIADWIGVVQKPDTSTDVNIIEVFNKHGFVRVAIASLDHRTRKDVISQRLVREVLDLEISPIKENGSPQATEGAFSGTVKVSWGPQNCIRKSVPTEFFVSEIHDPGYDVKLGTISGEKLN